MRVSISLPDGLARDVDVLRGDVPRSVWVRRALEMRVALEREARSERPVRVASADERAALSFPTPHDNPDPRVFAPRPHLPTCRCGVCKP